MKIGAARTQKARVISAPSSRRAKDAERAHSVPICGQEPLNASRTSTAGHIHANLQACLPQRHQRRRRLSTHHHPHHHPHLPSRLRLLRTPPSRGVRNGVVTIHKQIASSARASLRAEGVARARSLPIFGPTPWSAFHTSTALHFRVKTQVRRRCPHISPHHRNCRRHHACRLSPRRFLHHRSPRLFIHLLLLPSHHHPQPLHLLCVRRRPHHRHRRRNLLSHFHLHRPL